MKKKVPSSSKPAKAAPSTRAARAPARPAAKTSAKPTSAKKTSTKKTATKTTAATKNEPAKRASSKAPATTSSRTSGGGRVVGATAAAEAPHRGAPSSTVAARAQALEAVFTALGARDPSRWARSHVEDGVDQIGRFVFLRALWGRVVRDGRFLDKVRKERSELTAVVERLLLSGVDEGDLVALVRAMQVRLLVDACQIVDDPSDNDEGVRWGLWRMDKRGLPLWQLGDLRLDVLEVDPADDV